MVDYFHHNYMGWNILHENRNITKWVGTIAERDFTTTIVAEFIRVHIIDRFGVLETIMVNNGQPFKNAALYKLYVKYRSKEITHRDNMEWLIDW